MFVDVLTLWLILAGVLLLQIVALLVFGIGWYFTRGRRASRVQPTLTPRP